MKPTDLMIKDWVLWKNRYVQIARISGIVYSFGHIDILLAYCNDVGDGIETHDISKISPILLTPEILEKNGWERNGIFMEKRIDENTNLSWTDICGSVLSQGKYYMCDCNYVHTLQHALRLCGFDELANNFKI